MKVRIGFSDDPNWTPWGWAIKRYLGTTFYHVYFYLDDYNEIWESVVSGVRDMKREEWLKTHKVVKEFCFELSEERVNELRKYGQSRRGTPYGYFQYIAILLKLSWNNGIDRFICSEFVARAFAKELGYTIDTNFDVINPKMLYTIVKEKFGSSVDLWRRIKGMQA